MATSRQPVPIPKNTWVDLYDASGITLGTQIIVQNVGSADAWLSESATQPQPPNEGFNIITPRAYLTSASVPVGAWAFSELGTTLQVEES